MQLIGEQAAKSLGVDVAAAGARMSDAFRKSDEDMRTLILSLPALKNAGIDTGRVVGEALAKMIDSAKNTAEVDAIQRRIEALRDELGKPLVNGLLDQVKTKLADIKTAADNAKPGINSLEEALKDLGITSDQAFKNTAEKSKTAFDAAAASGVASARELSEAFKKAAEDAITANQGIAPEWVKSEAAARGYRLEIDESGKAILTNAKEAQGAMERMGGAVESAGKSFTGMREQAVAALQAMGIEAERVSTKVQRLVQDGQMLSAAFQQRQDNRDQELDASKYMNQGKTNAQDLVPTFNSQEEAKAWLEVWKEQYQRDNPFAVRSGGQLGNYMHDLTMFEFEREMDALKSRDAMKKAADKGQSSQGNSTGSMAGSGSGGSTGSGQSIDRVVNLYVGNSQAYPIPTNQTGQMGLESASREFMRTLEEQRAAAGS